MSLRERRRFVGWVTSRVPSVRRQKQLCLVEENSQKKMHFSFCFLVMYFLPRLGRAESGDGDGYLLRNKTGDNDSCIVPLYSLPLYSVNATESDTKLLFISGRCYLSCFNRYSVSCSTGSLVEYHRI